MGRVKEMMHEPIKVQAEVVLTDVTVKLKHLLLLATVNAVPEYSGEDHPECFEIQTKGAIFDVDESDIDQAGFEKLLELKEVQDQIHDQAIEVWLDERDRVPF